MIPKTNLPSICALVAMMNTACSKAPSEGWDWGLPAGFPEPEVPADNPMTQAKVDLGRQLFYDKRLSANQTQSCSSCHQPALAFTDSLQRAIGSTGVEHPHNTMSLINVAYAKTLTWADSELLSLRSQAKEALFGEHPIELGMSKDDDQLVTRLENDVAFVDMFTSAFPESEGSPVSVEHILKAITSFERSLVSAGSPYDRYIGGDDSALSATAKNGMSLFFSERLECYHCHSGPNFASSIDHEGVLSDLPVYENIGLYNIDSMGGYPVGDTGLHAKSDRLSDMGRFKAPTLRNIATTAPYMHDGSIDTLEQVIDHYARGGRVIESGPNSGDGQKSPVKSPFVSGFELTSQERADLLAFLAALTDESALNRPEWHAPD